MSNSQLESAIEAAWDARDQISPQTTGEQREAIEDTLNACLLYTSPSPRDAHESRMPSSA